MKEHEMNMIERMLRNEVYDAEMNSFFDTLINEKQFYTDEMRKTIEDSLEKVGYWKRRKLYAEDYGFSIELTRSCNMNCSFCYAGSRKKSPTMTKEQIDAIFSFYEKYADDPQKIEETPYIRITGGEPLFNEQSSSLLRYVAEKWKNAEIFLYTNGTNLLKYYSYLPMERFGEVHVSVDGPRAIHLKRRCSGNHTDETVYDNIICGIQRLLSDKVKVKIKTIVDRHNYLYVKELRQLLKEKGILDSWYCEHLVSITLDFRNRLDIMEEVNNQREIKEIEAYLNEVGVFPATYPSLSALQTMLMRTENGLYSPQCSRCKNQILSNYFFFMQWSDLSLRLCRG